MKHIFLSFLNAALYNSVHSQSLIAENKIWSNVRHPTEYGYDFNSYYIKFQGDTLISEVLYKKVFRSNDSLMMNWSFYGSIRETDTGSVFYMPRTADVERLLYDFGIKEGESIEYNVDPSMYLYADSIRKKSFGIHDELRTIIYLSTGTGYNDETWIEGIGSRHGILLFPDEFLVVGEAFNLICFFENDSLKYHHNFYSSCFPSGKYYQIEKKVTNPSISIRNHSDVLIFDLNGTYNESSFKIFDISGRTLINQRIQESSITLEKSKYENGIYLYIIQTPKGYHCGKFVLN